MKKLRKSMSDVASNTITAYTTCYCGCYGYQCEGDEWNPPIKTDYATGMKVYDSEKGWNAITK